MDAKVDCHESCLGHGEGIGGGGGEEVRLTTQKTVRILQIKFLLKFNATTSLLDQIKTVSCSEAKKEIRGHSMYAFLIS